ncbi:permease-like cell division protein FtsX [Salibacterium qingdaonense]|uniref:Cell division protein FtsX n=1 Tax=Salibacterium qingdaonense TaxID=266892 RepID=A0A1I4KXU7_9BACI|nr:permease-like cell division protein FtsX [Salibacterium qingdaonense]SFL83595.1 cell division transport system permease protein [Salibacterium qingdaonense]
MKGRTLARHGKEGLKNLGRNSWMSFASVSAVTIMLFVVGVFLLLIVNMNSFISSVEEDVEVQVYIDLGTSDEEQTELRQQLQNLDHVDGISFVSKDEGLDQLIDSLDQQSGAFESLRNENPLNDKFVIQAEQPQQTEQVAEAASDLPYIDSIDYGEQVVEQLFNVTKILRIIGLVLVVGLMFTAMFLISNTIKLTIVARQQEIQIMKLVGATNGFIRWPFFVEGLLLGVLGAVIPIAAVTGGYHYLYNNYAEQLSIDFAEILPTYPLTLQISAVLVGIGILVGIWGSVTSVRKFLKV